MIDETTAASAPVSRSSSGKASAAGQCTVDFEKNGKQTGFFNLPLSVHDDAWGVVRIPVAVIKNGSGPTVIMEGGNHGDEYEGPMALGELIRELDPGKVSGRLIFIPAINLPAVMAARRTSPVDDLNMNRTFPGNPKGTTTQQIAAFVNDVLFPMGDAFLDLHSGGSSLDLLPSSVIEPVADPVKHAANVAAVKAFDAPLTVVIDNRGDTRTATSSAARAGLTVVGTEMAGCGTVSIDALNICRRGVRNVLAHLGVLSPEEAFPPQNEQKLYEIPAENGHVLATEDGFFEPYHAKGTEISAGQPAGRIHFLHDPAKTPVELTYGHDGIVYGHRHPGRVRPGNCCVVIAAPYKG